MVITITTIIIITTITTTAIIIIMHLVSIIISVTVDTGSSTIEADFRTITTAMVGAVINLSIIIVSFSRNSRHLSVLNHKVRAVILYFLWASLSRRIPTTLRI